MPGPCCGKGTTGVPGSLNFLAEVLLTGNSESAAGVAKLCAKVLDENKLQDIEVLHVVESLQIADYFVVASARNVRHIRAARDELVKKLREVGIGRRGIEGHGECKWVLIDLADVVVHLFLPDVRRYYDLDSLWGDCPHLEWADGDRGARLSATKKT